MTEPVYRKSGVPEGTRGAWSITRTRMPERTGAVVDERPDCFQYRPGEYVELRQNGITFMTDLYDEWYTQRVAIARAREIGGRVLITGLGLGLVVESMLASPAPNIREIVVLEQSAEVIELVAPGLLQHCGDRVEVIHADAFQWRAKAGEQFETVWHDIWPDPLAADVVDDIARLRLHHAPWSISQGFWPEHYRKALEDTSLPTS